MPSIFFLLILVISVIGWSASWYIYRHRQHGHSIDCVIDVDCQAIIASRYNQLFGYRNDQLGLGYFSLAAILSILGIILVGSLWVWLMLLVSSLVAGGYAIYLIYIQLRVLKQACTWCLVPTIAAVAILLAVGGLGT